MSKKEIKYCEEHPNRKAVARCLSCDQGYCQQCSDEAGEECMSCIPTDLIEI